MTPIRCGMALLIIFGSLVKTGMAQKPTTEPVNRANSVERVLVTKYCADCHNNDEKAASLALDSISLADVNKNTDIWEKVVRKLRVRQMPPANSLRPEEGVYDAVILSLETSLDHGAAEKPNPGRTDTFRRLNRNRFPMWGSGDIEKTF